jgi:hypothetical protein
MSLQDADSSLPDYSALLQKTVNNTVKESIGKGHWDALLNTLINILLPQRTASVV